MAVLSLGMGWMLAGRMLRPVHELTGAGAPAVGANLHERIRLQRPPDELKELADTFDACSSGSTPPSPRRTSSSRTPRTSCARR